MIFERSAENFFSARRWLFIPLLLLFGCGGLFCLFMVGLGWNRMTISSCGAGCPVVLSVSAFTTVHGRASGWLHDYQGFCPELFRGSPGSHHRMLSLASAGAGRLVAGCSHQSGGVRLCCGMNGPQQMTGTRLITYMNDHSCIGYVS
ncbi:hypothetical protein [Arthrobacter sp. NPDC057013]|uniref:hypothetical protein n=1 Tax=Arthrobacter sp. NPDC057013 TaxID=3345999 RepID=UPI00362CEB5F